MASKRKSIKNIEHIMDNLRQQNLNISNENDSCTKQLRISDEILSKNMAVIQSITNNFFQQNSVTNNNNNCLLTMNMDQQQQQRQRQQQQVADQSIETPTTTTTNDDISIYRGLYPINKVKQYFDKQIIDGKKKYICLWNNCQFSTWNYSQHISRHIYLKHIGIKKLQCNIFGCGKMFKRPESLVQHKKNHNCGFGIDNQRMKDPKNLCGDRNIRHYFSRQLDNDIFVYQCQFGQCKFHTHNSGSIRRHVHNQHICPFSASNNNNNNNNNNSNQSNNNNYNNIQQQQQQQEYSTTTTKNHQNNNNIDDRKSIIYYDDSNDSNDQLSTSPLAANVEVQLNEFDNQSYDPERRQIIQSKPCEQQQKKLPLSLSPSTTTTTTTTTMNEDSFEDFPIEDFDDIEDDIDDDDDDDDIDVDVDIDDDDIDEDIDDNHSINGQNQIIEHLQQTSSMIQLTNVDDDDDDDDDDYGDEHNKNTEEMDILKQAIE